ncbi:ATP-binding cassette domain-containing protein [Coxiella burnetii]|uniref:ATP-binding cassette domain-containing protein n=1 Tax=Coxiella burnetii TaxID=777 RepID=UPI000163A245|nr:ATP-binding cassette domain-containing protein [Coxiella burnetii]ATN86139.1 ABC transporter ATP-binding protein [Coxiella burnetii str. Schperling]EDR35777.1 ABC transporter, ATP-binding protein [Coxiella burnetii Q321]PHH57051.1 ABC transporter ATP-binding protein [Coxiella burnetii]
MELTIRNLSKAYSGRQIFNRLSFTFECGVNYLVAPNGTGKSTLLKLIADIEKKDRGEILFNGFSKKFSDYGSYVPDKITMCPFITGQEFLNIVNSAKGSSKEEPLLSDLLKCFNISQYLGVTFSKMSFGTQKKFFLMAGLVGDFSCLLMDEPSNAIDKQSIDTVIACLNEISKDKMILIATHDQYLQSQLPGSVFELNSNSWCCDVNQGAHPMGLSSSVIVKSIIYGFRIKVPSK